jgi:hypothetical protein
VKALLALNPDHKIFNKDYVPGANEKVRRGQNQEYVPADEEDDHPKFAHFDEGLPSYLNR